MAKIGILLCDGTYPEIREKWGNYEDCFVNLLTHMNYDFSAHRVWHCLMGEYPSHIDDADIYIISGSKYSAYEPFNWIAGLKDFIIDLDKAQKKLLGFCFGHQLIHESLGGKVQLAPQGWGLGAYPVYMRSSINHLQKDSEIRILAMHQDQVIKTAPGFITLASSSFCPHAITQKKNHILSFQSHPEFQNPWFEMLCQRVCPRAGRSRVKEAMRTLSQQKNKQNVLSAIKSFLEV